MENEIDRIRRRLEAQETALLVTMEAMAQSSPDLRMHLIQKFNAAIIDADWAADFETKDPDEPSSLAGKDLLAFKAQFKALT